MITFKSENVDGEIIDWEFDSIADVLKDWWNEDGTNLPSGEDRVYEYNINGNTIDCDILFDTFIQELETQYWNDLKL